MAAIRAFRKRQACAKARASRFLRQVRGKHRSVPIPQAFSGSFFGLKERTAVRFIFTNSG
jgi:hypothetical protein